MTHSMKEPSACTEEELQQAVASLLTQSGSQTLNDTDIQEFWQVYREIQRRLPRSGVAAA